MGTKNWWYKDWFIKLESGGFIAVKFKIIFICLSILLFIYCPSCIFFPAFIYNINKIGIALKEMFKYLFSKEINET